MKKTNAITALLGAAVILALSAGCGDSGEDARVDTPMQQEQAVAVLDDELQVVEEDLAGTFESIDGLFISFSGDGTFETDAFGDRSGGTYEVAEGSFTYDITLSFADGSEDILGVVYVDGKVRGVYDTMGIHYIKQ